MDRELHHLRKALRQEKCPPQVRVRIAERISAERASRPRRLSAIPRFALACVAGMLLLAGFLCFPRQRVQSAADRTSLKTAEHALVVEQTKISLAWIGYALMEAGASSKTAVEEQSLPPLKESLEKVKRSLSKEI